MKVFKSRIDILLIVLALIGVIFWVSYEMINSNKKEEHYNVSVIVDHSNSDRWTAFREGLEQAADDDNVSINFVSSEAIKSVQEQDALMQREVVNAADGIILEPYSSNDMSDIIANIASRAAIVLLDTEVSPEGVYTTVKPNNTAIGEAIGQALIRDLEGKLSDRKIGILCGNLNKSSMRDRLGGVKNILEGVGAKVEWTIDQDLALSEELSRIQEKSRVDIIISLGNDETEAAVDYILQNGAKNILLYGEGCSEKLVYYLDKGIIKVLVVPNEFNMGYLSMKAVTDTLRYMNTPKVSAGINFLVINKENLYDEDNQKMLFPIVQ
jgi:hypothetical protein